jgi:hypothetical protein
VKIFKRFSQFFHADLTGSRCFGRSAKCHGRAKRFSCDPAESSISIGMRKGTSLLERVNEILAGITKTTREEMMDAAIARQPISEE